MAVKMYTPNYLEIPLFQGLDMEEINEVLQKFHGLIKHFPKSDYIYLAGDCVENLCVVLEGTVQMIKEDIWGEKSIIANLGVGSVFAENFLGQLGDRSAVSYFVAAAVGAEENLVFAEDARNAVARYAVLVEHLDVVAPKLVFDEKGSLRASQFHEAPRVEGRVERQVAHEVGAVVILPGAVVEGVH